MIDIVHAVRAAKELVSEDGENPEYDRAIVELMCDLLSIPTDHKVEVAALLGVRGESLAKIGGER
jgi:hypothetical protein